LVSEESKDVCAGMTFLKILLLADCKSQKSPPAKGFFDVKTTDFSPFL